MLKGRFFLAGLFSLCFNRTIIIPVRYLNTDNEAELASHCLEDLDSDFVKKVKEGDVIVAGEDFGCGSSREHAVWAICGGQGANGNCEDFCANILSQRH